jgi:hypothetical protein
MEEPNIIQAKEALQKLTDEERLIVISEYCYFCGQKEPCECFDIKDYLN